MNGGLERQSLPVVVHSKGLLLGKYSIKGSSDVVRFRPPQNTVHPSQRRDIEMRWPDLCEPRRQMRIAALSTTFWPNMLPIIFVKTPSLSQLDCREPCWTCRARLDEGTSWSVSWKEIWIGSKGIDSHFRASTRHRDSLEASPIPLSGRFILICAPKLTDSSRQLSSLWTPHCLADNIYPPIKSPITSHGPSFHWRG